MVELLDILMIEVDSAYFQSQIRASLSMNATYNDNPMLVSPS